MSAQVELKPGGQHNFGTNVIGIHTQLTLQGPGKNKGTARAKYRYVLCCTEDTEVILVDDDVKTIDVTSAKGALLSVRNVGISNLTAWTDA